MAVKVGNAQTTSNVDKNVFLDEFKANPLLQNSKQHIQTTLVETGGRALGSAVGSSGDQGLRLYEEGTDAFDGSGDSHS